MRGRVEIRQETEIGKFIVLLPKKLENVSKSGRSLQFVGFPVIR